LACAEKSELIWQNATYPLAYVKAEHLLGPEAVLEKEAWKNPSRACDSPPNILYLTYWRITSGRIFFYV